MTYRNSRNTSRNSAQPLTPEEWATIEKLYNDKRTDLEIADHVGVSSKTVARWRWSRDLERNDR